MENSVVATIEELENLEKKIHVVCNKENVEQAFSNASLYVQKNAQVKGFRKGMVPLQLIKNSFNKEIRQVAEEMLVNSGFLQVCSQYKIRPLESPVLGDKFLGVTGAFEFDLNVRCFPEVKLESYIGLELEKPQLNNEDVSRDVFQNVQSKLSKQEEIEAVEIESIVVVDFEVVCGEKVVSNGADQHFYIRAGLEAPFGENLVGKKKGDVCVEDILMPEQSKEFANQQAKVSIKIKNIFKNIVPSVEEMATMFSKSVEEFNEYVKQLSVDEVNRKTNLFLEESLITKLVELNGNFDVPNDWVEQEEKYIINQYGVKDIDKNIKVKIKEMAERNVKRTFILEAIYDLEGSLQLTKEEVEGFLEEEAKRANLTINELKTKLAKENLETSVVGLIKHRKVINFLLSSATFIEKPTEIEIPESPF